MTALSPLFLPRGRGGGGDGDGDSADPSDGGGGPRGTNDANGLFGIATDRDGRGMLAFICTVVTDVTTGSFWLYWFI